MTHHKAVAVRMDQRGDNFTLTGITQSPRGTKTMSGVVKFQASKSDRKKRIADIQAALKELLESDQ